MAARLVVESDAPCRVRCLVRGSCRRRVLPSCCRPEPVPHQTTAAAADQRSSANGWANGLVRVLAAQEEGAVLTIEVPAPPGHVWELIAVSRFVPRDYRLIPSHHRFNHPLLGGVSAYYRAVEVKSEKVDCECGVRVVG